MNNLSCINNDIWNRMTIDSMSFLLCTRYFSVLKLRMISFNLTVIIKNGTLTSRSIFTDKSTQPKKGIFSSLPHCTLSESQLSRKEILSCMEIPKKLILVYLYSQWKLALLRLVVTLMVCSWLYCWLCIFTLPPLQQFRFHILFMVYRSTWICYLASLLFLQLRRWVARFVLLLRTTFPIFFPTRRYKFIFKAWYINSI